MYPSSGTVRVPEVRHCKMFLLKEENMLERRNHNSSISRTRSINHIDNALILSPCFANILFTLHKQELERKSPSELLQQEAIRVSWLS